MLDHYARGLFTVLMTPIARVLKRMGVTPDAVTIVGSLGACLAALIAYPAGQLFWGTLIITFFIFSDLVDGVLARLPDADGNPPVRTEGASKWGAFLDSTLDRVVDFVIFGSIAYWFFTGGGRPDIGALALACLSLGGVVSYARAKAESLGLTANVGIAERSERIVLVLVFTGLNGLGLSAWVLYGVLWLLAAASTITVFQRVGAVRKQTLGAPAAS